MWVLLTAVSRCQPRGGTHTRSSSASSPGGRGSALGRPFVEAALDGARKGSDPMSSGIGATEPVGSLIGSTPIRRTGARSLQLLQEHRERLQRTGIELVVRRHPRARLQVLNI